MLSKLGDANRQLPQRHCSFPSPMWSFRMCHSTDPNRNSSWHSGQLQASRPILTTQYLPLVVEQRRTEAILCLMCVLSEQQAAIVW